MTSINLSLIRRNNFRCLLVLFATLGAAVDPTLLAQIDPRRMTPVVLAAGGPTGPYFERFGLRYYREAYPGTTCFNETPIFVASCLVGGDYHAEDIYFPSTELEWI